MDHCSVLSFYTVESKDELRFSSTVCLLKAWKIDMYSIAHVNCGYVFWLFQLPQGVTGWGDGFRFRGGSAAGVAGRGGINGP